MRKLGVFLVVLVSAGTVIAQSSGNFAARIATMQCEVNDVTGALSGGLTGTMLTTTVKTPNSGLTALDIRPSMVTGLFTRNRVSNDTDTATAVAGVKVRVLMDGKIVSPGIPAGVTPSVQPTDGQPGNLADDGNPNNDGWVYYNKRFVQLSTNIFNILDDDCDPVEAGVQPCFIELIQSTLTANSLDFVAGDVGGGVHTIKVEWMLQPTAANANEAACVGPGVLTVTQMKTFTQSGGIDITSNN